MSVMVNATLLISVESIVESWISTMEHHSSQRRTMGEMLLHEEMVISVNGPKMVDCEAICQEALCDDFIDKLIPRKERAGHFVRRSENNENYSVSKNVDNFRKQQPKENIML